MTIDGIKYSEMHFKCLAEVSTVDQFMGMLSFKVCNKLLKIKNDLGNLNLITEHEIRE